MSASASPSELIESRYAWLRLIVSVLVMTIGCVGMYSATVALPQIEAEFGISRSSASLPYTFTMIGFGLGGILMGRLTDRFSVQAPLIVGAVCLGLGFVGAGLSSNIWQFNIMQGVFIGLLGSAGTFTPLVADTSQWFNRRRGIALALCMSGNYLAGAVWPPIMQHFIDTVGWRSTYMGIGVFCTVSLLSLVWVYRQRPPNLEFSNNSNTQRPDAPFLREISRSNPDRPLGFTPRALQNLLCIAGVACCVAMSMPQVHIVAYCGDLGFGAARGAEMLALMLGFGIVSRLISGAVSDRIGGLRTLLLGSTLQGVALVMFLFSTGLVSLYLVSILFGLFQGGIVPAYALIVREFFNTREAGTRVGTVLMATLLGMALGGWMSGALYDLTGSYRAAFLNGIAWNLLNMGIVGLLLWRARRQPGTGQSHATV